MSKLKISNVIILLVCLGNPAFGQTYDPVSLHFKKEYQVRNFYNSSVLLSKLDLSQDVLDESKFPIKHVTTPGCTLEKNGQVLAISNNRAKPIGKPRCIDSA